MNFQRLHFYSLRLVLLIIATTTAFAQVVDLSGNPGEPLKSAKVVALIFVRTDCPISNRYAPEIKRLVTKYQSQEMKFFLVYAGKDQKTEDIKKHVEEFGFELAAIRDPNLLLVKKSGVTVTPEAVVWQQEKIVYRGRIDNRFVAFGKMRTAPTSHDLEGVLETVSKGKTVTKKITKAIGCFIS